MAKRKPTVIPPDPQRGVTFSATLPRLVVGAGGGGKGGGNSQRTPVEQPDSLRVKQYASVLDLVSEGPWDGPAAPGLQWIKLDGTPVQNADGTYNFRDVTAAWVNGDPTQGYINGFPDVTSDVAVSTKATVAASVTRTVTDSNLDAVVVHVQVPQLSYLDSSTGDLKGNSVSLAIDVNTNGGGFVQMVTDTISGKTMKPYERSYRVELTGAGPWDIRVRRTSADSGGSNDQKDLYWIRYTKVVDKRFSYPNSAIVGLQVNAEQFNNIPVRSYLVRGMKVKVPSNYDPNNRTYTGSWDGTFKTAWTNNPVWCWYDLCLNTRYGAGRWIQSSNLDKWALYTIAQYCDGWLPTGAAKRAAVSATGLTLTASASGSTLTRSSGAFMAPRTTVACTVNGGTISSAGVDWAALGFQVGDSVTLSGFRNAGNNTTVTLATVALNVMTVSGSPFTLEEGQFITLVNNVTADGFQAGDEVAVAGFSTSSNNGRAVIQSVTRATLTLKEHTYTDEGPTAGCSITTQDPTEPRFACNLYLQTPQDAITVLRNMASIFRAMLYFAGGYLVPVQDAPASPVHIFTPANVVGGKFSYSSSSKLDRHTVALVQWNDPSAGYKPRTEPVIDDEGVARYGLNPVKVPAMGCTSQGQARRLGLWTLYTERMETDFITFALPLEGAALRPGQLFQVHDPQKAGRSLGGRIQSSSLNGGNLTVTLDRQITIESGKTYSMGIITGSTITSLPVSNGPGTYQQLTLTGASSAPADGAIFIITVSDLAPTLWRALSITEENGNYKVEGVASNQSKYAAVESGALLQLPPTSVVVPPLAPQQLTLSESLINRTGDLKPVFQASWMPPPGTLLPECYEVRWRRETGAWFTDTVHGTHWELVDCALGAYDFRVAARYANGAGPSVTASYTVLGKAANPSDVTGLTATWSSSGLSLSWTPIADLDADQYELRQGASWAAGTPLEGSLGAGNGTRVKATAYQWRVPTLPPPTIWIKAIDTTGHYSTNAASVAPTNPSTTYGSLTLSVSNSRPA